MREPSEPELLIAAVRAGVAQINTSIPGIVQDYDAATKTATVQPAVYAKGDEPFAPIPDVPIAFPAGGGFRVVFPIEPGDEVLLEFQALDPSRFLESGEVSQVNTKRRHGLYPIAKPANLSAAKLAAMNASTEGVHLGTNDGLMEIVIGSDQIKLGSVLAADGVANGVKVDEMLSTIKDWLDAHVHGTAVGPSTPPTNPPLVLETTASDKVFLEGDLI